MKVLQITAFSGWGCTGRIALGIHKALEEQGHESIIAWGRTDTTLDSVHTIKIGNSLDQKMHGLYTRLTDKCGFGSIAATKKFIKQIDEFHPDLIQMHILHGYYVNLEVLFNYIKEKNIPIVWTFHDCWAFTGHCPYFDYVQCEKWKTGCPPLLSACRFAPLRRTGFFTFLPICFPPLILFSKSQDSRLQG